VTASALRFRLVVAVADAHRDLLRLDGQLDVLGVARPIRKGTHPDVDRDWRARIEVARDRQLGEFVGRGVEGEGQDVSRELVVSEDEPNQLARGEDVQRGLPRVFTFLNQRRVQRQVAPHQRQRCLHRVAHFLPLAFRNTAAPLAFLGWVYRELDSLHGAVWTIGALAFCRGLHLALVTNRPAFDPLVAVQRVSALRECLLQGGEVLR
jgi:hypothetical protein